MMKALASPKIFALAACGALLALGAVRTAQAAGEAKAATMPVPAITGKAATLDLTYNLYIAGLTFGSVDMSARMEGADYKVVSDLLTKGIVNRFWQAKITATANGEIKDGRMVPQIYDSYSENPRRTQKVKLAFDDSGPTALDADPAYDTTTNPVSDDLKKNTLDPTSAVLSIARGLSVSDKNPCGTPTPVFDGRRRYNVEFEFVKRTDVRLDNGLYEGPALVCQVKYHQIAGFSQSILRNGVKLPNIYAWVARVPNPNDPAKPYFVPLRLWANTEFGMVAVVVSELKLNGQAVGKPG